jgi:hypothetical protein
MRVNAITRDHAEADAFQQASTARVHGGIGHVRVDIGEICGGLNGLQVTGAGVADPFPVTRDVARMFNPPFKQVDQ